jgi:hypothetical protein
MPTTADQYFAKQYGLSPADLDDPPTEIDADALADAIKRDPSFIGEAIGNADLTALVEAYRKTDTQWCWDAIHDIVDAHFDAELRRRPERLNDAAVAGLAGVFGVEL